jgi:hypothetical protein
LIVPGCRCIYFSEEAIDATVHDGGTKGKGDTMLIQLTLAVMLLSGARDPMTNQDVLDLVSRGVSSNLIVAMIKNSEVRFETTTDAILALRQRGVPDGVLEAMLYAEGPPDLSDDGRLMIYVSDSQSWQISGGFGFGDDGGAGATSGGARPQTAEIIKTFQERCPEIAVTNERARADFVVLLDHEGGKTIFLKDNKVAVFGRDGTTIYSGSTRSLGNAVKDACGAIRAVEDRWTP